MKNFSPDEVALLFLGIGVLLITARVLGGLARKIGQPAIIGEVLAGVLLGPTILGRLAPSCNLALFPPAGPVSTGLETFTTIGLVMFLLMAGLETDLSSALRQRKKVLFVSSFGMAFPFILGAAVAWFFPYLLMEVSAAQRTPFTLFFAAALCISALPIIIKILMDLNLYKTDLALVIVSSAMFNDLLGWIIFTVVVAFSLEVKGGFPVWLVLPVMLALVLFLLTIGQRPIRSVLRWLQANNGSQAGVLGFALGGAFVCGAFTQWIGLSEIFGAFLFGIALSHSGEIKAKTRATLDQVVYFILAPMFFATIGLRADFAANFDWVVVLTVLVVATLGKVLGCTLGARLGGLPRRESWLVGWGMNARGVMEIVFGLMGLNYGLIDERLFVALAVMSLTTSIMSGVVMKGLVRRAAPESSGNRDPSRIL